MNSERSPSAGGYDFPRDPDKPFDRRALFWLPSLQPATLLFTPVTPTFAAAAMPINLARLPSVDLRRAPDGWHGYWPRAGVGSQFRIREMPVNIATTYAVTLSLDALFELRVHAATRFWRILSGRAPGGSYREMPVQLRQLNILRLRAVDARRAGASYRKIAEVLLNFRGNKEDFEHDPRKNKARRLVMDGDAYVHGGYREFLYYPIRLRH